MTHGIGDVCNVLEPPVYFVEVVPVVLVLEMIRYEDKFHVPRQRVRVKRAAYVPPLTTLSTLIQGVR